MKRKIHFLLLLTFTLLTIWRMDAQGLKANFSYSIHNIQCTTITFTDSSTGNPAYYTWYFSDGHLDWSGNPTHKFYTNSIVSATLYIRRFDSSTNTMLSDSITKYIDLRNCNTCFVKANIQFGGDSTIPYNGTLLNFSLGPIHQHFWDFGDGGTSNIDTPQHTYTNPGRYTITYIATDTIKKCSDTAKLEFGIDSAGFRKRQAFILTVLDRTNIIIGLKDIAINPSVDLLVYPNPAGNDFNIKGLSQVIKIYDLKGNLILTQKLKDDEAMNVITENWAKGLYIVTGTAGQHLKLLIE